MLAGGLAAVTVVGTLGGWIATGWPSVRAEAEAVRTAPTLRAEGQARELAAELSARLEALRASEGERPYYQYSNLFHDPRGASEGLSVTPSPLARGPQHDLVAAHFQIDASGRLTMPTINEELPELSEPSALADNRALLEDLRAAASELGGRPTLVASAEPARAPPQAPEPQAIQVQTLDPEVYAQNAAPNVVYRQVQQKASPRRAAAGEAAPVRVVTSAFAWRSVRIDGAPRLVAVRDVATPDGALTQGLILDADAADGWLRERTPGAALVPERPERGIHAPVDASGGSWHVAVDPGPALVAAAGTSASIEAGFWRRLVPIALAALVCAVLLVLVVWRAERLARERSQFAAAAAHELRTPLAGLQLYGDMLADGLGDPDRAAVYARRVADEAARLGRVVANVLGFTQLERGVLSVDVAPGDASEAARRAVERARPALEHAGVTLEVDLPEAMPARFDDDAVQRILSNLLDNAEKYTRERTERTVRVRGRLAADAVAIRVEDDGDGVPARLQSRLFSAFSRGDDADGPAGLGLGLALSRGLARQQGGDLSYTGDPGAGAAFTLRLPR